MSESWEVETWRAQREWEHLIRCGQWESARMLEDERARLFSDLVGINDAMQSDPTYRTIRLDHDRWGRKLPSVRV